MFFTKLKNEPCNIHKYYQVGKFSLYTRVNFPVEIQLPAEGTHLFIHKMYGAEQYKDELGWPWSTWGIGLRGQRTGQRTGRMTGHSTGQDQGCQWRISFYPFLPTFQEKCCKNAKFYRIFDIKQSTPLCFQKYKILKNSVYRLIFGIRLRWQPW